VRKIEEVINDTLKDDMWKNALDFIGHLRADEGFSVSNEKEGDKSFWVKYKGKLVCEISMNGSENFSKVWTVWVYGDCIGEHEDSSVSEGVKAVAWASITPCRNCGAECSPGRRKTVFGKAFDNVCQTTLMFENPDTETLDCMKKIVDISKKDILSRT